MSLLRPLIACVIAAFPAGCGSFQDALREFDVVAGIDGQDDEPTQLDYEANVVTWSTAFEGEQREVDDFALENPTGFARNRMIAMLNRAGGDTTRMAESVYRMLLVASIDESVLNGIEAHEGIADVLRELEVDPLDHILVGEPSEAQSRTEGSLSTLRELAPSARTDEFDLEARKRYLDALRLAAAAPLATPADDRQLLRLLVRSSREEVAEELVQPTRDALLLTMANSCSRALALALLRSDVRIREAGTLAIYRLSGTKSLPLLLAALSRRDGARFRYPNSSRERRGLLRLCSQVRGDLLFRSALGGPRPVDFIYDTIAQGESEGIQLLALETLARCLGRPVDFDRDWADQWWRELALRQDTRS